MNLMYYIIGEHWQYYNQCYFSLYSFQQFNEINDIYIYTDAPHFFNKLEGRVRIIELDEAKKAEWRGEVDFNWRVKIKAIEDMSLNTSELFLYVDTDTFLYKPLEPMCQGLESGKAYMHLNEGRLKDMKHTPYKMGKQIQGKEFGGIMMTDDLYMWNAGVVALPLDKRLEAARLALDITDDMCNAGVTRRLIEQFALSVALEKTCGLNAADSMIAHYWGNKPGWDAFVNSFIIKQYHNNSSFEESVDAIKSINLSEIPYNIHRSSSRQSLVRLLDKLFPDKNIKYL